MRMCKLPYTTGWETEASRTGSRQIGASTAQRRIQSCAEFRGVVLDGMEVPPRKNVTTPVSRRFVITWLGVVIGVVGVLFPAVTMLVLNWSDGLTTKWIYETRQRKQRMIALETAQPRILIAGGSSGFFSLDAELLSAKLGRTVLNTATHAGLGRRFILQDLRDSARKGDTVLLYFEYSQYGADAEKMQEFERKFLWTYDPLRILTLEWPLSARQIYGNPFSDYRDSLVRFYTRFRNRKNPPPIWTGYSFVELSPNGDIRNAPSSGEIKPLSPEPNQILAPETEKKLKEFFSWARSNDVGIIAMLPAVARSEGIAAENLRAYGQKIERFYRESGVKLVSIPELQQLPREFYWDTEYHASSAGRRVITERLTPEIQKALGVPSNAQGEPHTYLVRSPTERFNPALSFAANSQMECRYLATGDLDHPLSLTLEEVRAAVKAGKRFRFSESDVGKLLEQAGVASRLVERKQTSVRDWMGRYPQHLFAVVAIGEQGKDLAINGVARPFDSVFQNKGAYRVALFGSGKYAGSDKIESGQQTVASKPMAGAHWPAKNGIPLEIEIRSAASYAREKGEAALLLDRHCIFDGTETGLGIAVIDPDRGILVDRRVFSSPEFVEYELAETTSHTD